VASIVESMLRTKKHLDIAAGREVDYPLAVKGPEGDTTW